MGDGRDEVWEAAMEHIRRAEEELRHAAEMLRGAAISPSARAMRVEQQVSRAISSLWGIDF